MVVRKKIKVLIVDDSLLYRKALALGLSADPIIEVVGTAGDPFEARDKIIELLPDVLTLDVEMPKMDGIEFLRRLMPQYPLPVVMLSSLSGKVFDALNAGAVDFVNKPDLTTTMESMINELKVKIKIASTANLSHWKSNQNTKPVVNRGAMNPTTKIIAIGASTGGTEATSSILQSFTKDMPGIVIVQHMPPLFTKMYADRLNRVCALEIKEAENGDLIIPGRAVIAPGNMQMKLHKKGSGFSVEVFHGDKVNGHCPSVDVLFESVSAEVGKHSLGVILTGMGRDGAKGLLSMRKNGARTLGQDEQSCDVYGMPKVAFDIGAVQKQVPLRDMAHAICSVLNS
jgi:two-component system chemotaxis response regulator CheB